MSMLARLATSGAHVSIPVYSNDVFRTVSYVGNGAAQTFSRDINLLSGGMVWTASRDSTGVAGIFDTARGQTKVLYPYSAAAETTVANIGPFSTTGYSFTGATTLNTLNKPYVSWSFRESPKFFRIVTYTGDGTTNRVLEHGLNATPAMVLVKARANLSGWYVADQGSSYRTTLGNFLVLNSPGSVLTSSGTTGFGTTSAFTASDFRVGTDDTNAVGVSYIAYVFANDTAADGIIECGSYTGNGAATGPAISLGWEPQWVMIKRVTGGNGNWIIIDSTRGMTDRGLNELFLEANTVDAEGTADFISPTPTGFNVISSNTEVNANTSVYTYLAIRRSNKPPTTGASVFYSSTLTSNVIDNLDGVNPTSVGEGIMDLHISRFVRAGTGTPAWLWFDNMRGLGTSTGGAPILDSSSSAAESLRTTNPFVSRTTPSTGFERLTYNGTTSPITYKFRRAPGFFDIVCYAGTGANTTVNHNLGVAPEMVIIAARDGTPTRRWSVGHKINSFLGGGVLNTNAAFIASDNTFFRLTAPTASVITLPSSVTNDPIVRYVAYLFATRVGISKVGNYTGAGGTVNTNGTGQTIACDFNAPGARFVLIKRTDSTGDWYVFDTTRGIVAATEPYLLLNSTAVEVTTGDVVDPSNGGFIVNQTSTTNLNVTGATYIFLAVA